MSLTKPLLKCRLQHGDHFATTLMHWSLVYIKPEIMFKSIIFVTHFRYMASLLVKSDYAQNLTGSHEVMHCLLH